MFSVVKDGKVDDVVYRKVKHPETGELLFYAVDLFGKPLCQIHSYRKGEWVVIVHDDHSPTPIERKYRLVYGFCSRYHCVEYALKTVGIWKE